MTHSAAFLFLLLVSLPSASARAAGVDDLVARAGASRLWTNRYWSTLVHYKPTLLGVESRIDDPKFFLAPDGKTDPRAEMLATIRAFFEPVGTNQRPHAIYRFPARLHWLKQELNWDGAGLPMQEAENFRRVHDLLNPTTAALIFPAAYLGSPASMFGHTMIVFDAPGKNRLLSQAMTYAALTGQGFGPLFALEGIFGFYKGYYSALPYYDKVEEYTAIGHRDVWEYELDFTPEEVEQMFRHAWELQDIFSYYYFFTENCSFNLFYLLDAARPSLDTASFSRPFVIPVDTVKYLDGQGLFRAKSYRPSQVSRIRWLAENVSEEHRHLALACARGRTNAADMAAAVTNREEKVRMLDLASEYTQFLYTDRQLDPKDYRPRFIQTLKTRAALGKGDDISAQVPVPAHPEDGHAPAKATIGVGLQNDDAFASLYLRPAYHGLLDNDTGYTRGAQIEFLNLEVRGYPGRDRFELQNVDLVEVLSLAPRDELFQPDSWRVKMGVTQSDRYEDQDRLMAHVNTAAGETWRTGKNGIWFATVEAEAQLGRDFDHDYAIGGGPSLGLVQSVTPWWKIIAQGRALFMGIGDDFWTHRYSIDQDFRLRRNLSIGLGASWQRVDENDQTEFVLRLNRYF